MGTKTVDRKYVDHVCELVRELVDRDFRDNPDEPGNQTRAASRIGISQAQVSALYNKSPGKGIGLPVLLALRAYTSISLDDLLGLPPMPAQLSLERIQQSLDVLKAQAAPATPPVVHPRRPHRPRRTKHWTTLQEGAYHLRSQRIRDAELAAKAEKARPKKAKRSG